MTYIQPVSPASLEMHVTPGCTDAAVYQNGTLADHGHFDEVSERLIAALGVSVDWDSNPFLATDARGRSTAAATLTDLTALQEKASTR